MTLPFAILAVGIGLLSALWVVIVARIVRKGRAPTTEPTEHFERWPS